MSRRAQLTEGKQSALEPRKIKQAEKRKRTNKDTLRAGSSQDQSVSSSESDTAPMASMTPEEFANLIKSPVVATALKDVIGVTQILTKFEGKFEDLKANLKEKDNEISDLKSRVDSLEQQQRIKTLRIVGIPEKTDENMAEEQNAPETLEEKIRTFIKEKLNVNLTRDDINTCYRVGKKEASKTRPIMLSFAQEKKKAEVYRQRIQLKTQRPLVFLNEDLTPQRAKLYADTRKLVKEHKLHSSWTMDGKICAKETATSKVLTMNNHQMLEKYLAMKIAPKALGAPGAQTYADTVTEATTTPPGEQTANDNAMAALHGN